MANKFIMMLLVRQLIMFLIRGLTIRAIAIELSIGAKTVAIYRRRIEHSNRSLQELLILDDISLAEIIRPPAEKSRTDIRRDGFNTQLDYFLSELARKRASRVILFEQYSKRYPDGFKYSKFCELIKAAQSVKNATLYNIYTPGDRFLFDFTGNPLTYIDPRSGEVVEVVEVPIFVALLAYSNYSYVEALANASLPQVVKALNGCLTFWGGAPRSAKTDNMRQVVVRASCYEPTFTEGSNQWSLHYGVALLTARVRRPRDYAKKSVM